MDDKEWINKFGEIWFMQYLDEHPGYPSDKLNFYACMDFLHIIYDLLKDAKEII